MAKEKKESSGEETPAWLITFSDLMTLLLTFFVLLLSMASMIDERKKKEAWGSVAGTFGIGNQGVNMLSKSSSRNTWEPGPMDDMDDLQWMRPLLWEDIGQDIDLQTSYFMQILSIDSAVLFKPGEGKLQPKGEKILKLILPVLKRVSYPLRLSGHTSVMRDELGYTYKPWEKEEGIDLSWRLALQRTLSVYEFLLQGGLSPEKIRMEAFGRFWPKFSNDSPQGRQKNRRVEIILDKRNSNWYYEAAEEVKSRQKKKDDSFIYKGFVFDLNSTANQ